MYIFVHSEFTDWCQNLWLQQSQSCLVNIISTTSSTLCQISYIQLSVTASEFQQRGLVLRTKLEWLISKWFQNCRRHWYFKSIVDIWHFDVNNQPLLYWEMVNTPDHWLLVTHCVAALHVDQSTTADSQREGTLVQQQHWAAAWQRPVGRTYSDYQRTPGWARPVAATGSEAREARLLASGTTLAPLVPLDYWHLAAYVTEQKFHHETRLILMSVLD